MATKKVVDIFKIEACEAKIELINQCRICLDNQEEMYDIMSVLGEDESTTVYKVFQNLTGISPSQDHELSSYICGSCFDKLNNGFTLRITAAATEKKFTKICSVCMNYNYSESFVETFDATLHLVDETVITVRELFEIGTGLSVPKNRPNNVVCSKCLHTLIDLQILRNEAQKTHEIMLDILETTGTSDSQEIEQVFVVEKMTTQESGSKDQQREEESQSENDYIDDWMIKYEEAEEHLEEVENAGTSYEEINYEIKEDALSCTVCLAEFNFSEDLERHMETHENSKPYKCQVCSEEFKRPTELRTHIFGSHKEMKCKICLQQFNSYRDLIRHMRTHKRRTYVCDICGKFCSTKGQLTGHMRIHTKEKPFACDICSKRFALKSGLNTHMHTHTHNTEKLEKTTKQESGSKDQQREEESQSGNDYIDDWMVKSEEAEEHLEEVENAGTSYEEINHEIKEDALSCTVCLEEFNFSEDLERHMETHENSKPYKCQVCSEEFKRPAELRNHIFGTHKEMKCKICLQQFNNYRDVIRHMRTHKRRTYVCDVCARVCSTQAQLTGHMRIHTKEKPFACDICSKRFALKSGLNTHMHTHNTEKLFTCALCSKKFRSLASLHCHKLTHSDKRPHECTLCSKGFKTRSSLGKHILSHTGERNFQCPHCPSKFIHHGVLKSHLTIHSTEQKIVCEVCNKSFNRIDNYKIHMRIHNNVRPYVCSICKKGFTVSRDCREHMETHSTERKHACEKCDKRFKTARYLWHHMRRCTETKEVEDPKNIDI